MTSHDLTKWVKTMSGVFPDATPVSLVLHVPPKGRLEFPVATRYRQEFTAPPGAQNPGPYIREFIYVVGKRPKLSRAKVALQVDGEKREWYFAGYYEGGVTEMQPHGSMFMIGPWSFDEPIDKYERKPYARYKLEIIPCSETKARG